jgi:hypothetical protein
MAERAGAQDLQPESDIALFQMKQLEQRITQLHARVAGLRAAGGLVDEPEELLRILQRSHELLRRFLRRIIGS